MKNESFPKIEKRSRAAFNVMFKTQPKIFKITRTNDPDELLGKVSSAETGTYHYKLEFDSGLKLNFIGKWKSRKVIINGAKIICCGDFWLLLSQLKNRKIFGFNNSEKRENIIHENITPKLKEHMTNLFWHIGDQNGIHFLAFEELKNATKSSSKDYKKIIETITDFHAEYYQKPECVEKLLLNQYSNKDYQKASKTLLKTWQKFQIENELIFAHQEIQEIESFIQNIDKEYTSLPQDHQSLTHNDLSNRNIFIKDGEVIIFDWEMACYQNPEHDLIELLCYDLSKLSDKNIIDLAKYFQNTLEKKTNRKLSDDEFKSLIRFNLLEYIVNKMSVMRAYNREKNIPTLKRLPKNAARLMRVFGI